MDLFRLADTVSNLKSKLKLFNITVLPRCIVTEQLSFGWLRGEDQIRSDQMIFIITNNNEIRKYGSMIIAHNLLWFLIFHTTLKKRDFLKFQKKSP
jgi:hypothetical protein